MKKLDFNRLQKEWYRRLTASGFKDIELSNGTLIDRNHLNYALACGGNVVRANGEYFTRARQYLWVGRFETEQEKRIWELHAEGGTVRAIGEQVGCSKEFAHRRVKKHRELMKAVLAEDEADGHEPPPAPAVTESPRTGRKATAKRRPTRSKRLPVPKSGAEPRTAAADQQ